MHRNMDKKVKNSYNMEFDTIDRKIMQALSDELSEIEVSEELIAKTLCSAGGDAEREVLLPHQNTCKKGKYSYSFWGGTIAAAILLFVILGLFVNQGGRKDKAEDFFVQENFFDTASKPGMSGGQQENNGMLSWEGEGSPADMPMEEDTREWLYQELLAAFNEEIEEFPSDAVTNEAEGSDGSISQEKLEGRESRKIVWQREDKILTCVIYLPDYQIEAVLQEGEKERQILLEDFVYAKELWELAAEQ